MSNESTSILPDRRPLLPVPQGLSKCPICGEYRGTMAVKGLLYLHGLSNDRDQEAQLVVRCLCDGPLCCRCTKRRIHRPISNSWNERNGFSYYPHFYWMIPCAECRAKEEMDQKATQARKKKLKE